MSAERYTKVRLTSSTELSPDMPLQPTMRLAVDYTPLHAVKAPGADSAVGLLVVAAGALGMSVRVYFGQYHPNALLWLTLSILATALAVFRSRSKVVVRLDRAIMPLLPAFAVCMAVVLLSDSPLATVSPVLVPFQIAIAVGAAGMLLGSVARRRLSRWGIALMLLGAGGACLWTLRVAPQPGADICIFQRESADALLHGTNPYSMTFEDPYANKSSFYGDGIVRDGRLQFGYPYPPLPLLMALPGHLFGDFRFSMMVAIVAAGALIAGMRPGRIAPLASGLLLFTPRGLFVLEAGWIEPLVVVLLASVVFVACRHTGSKAGTAVFGILTGLLFASKQYLIVAAPLLWLLPVVRHRATRWRFLRWVIATGLIVSLPLVLWNPKAFIWSVAILQFHQPFRPDALSYLVPLGNIWLQSSIEHPPSALLTLLLKPPAWMALSIAPIVAVLCARRLRPTPSNFAAAMAFTLIVLFAFNKQAFCNYYYLVIGALACAVGASQSNEEDLNQENTNAQSAN